MSSLLLSSLARVSSSSCCSFKLRIKFYMLIFLSRKIHWRLPLLSASCSLEQSVIPLESDAIPVFVYDVKSTKHVESIVHSSLYVFEVKFLQDLC